VDIQIIAHWKNLQSKNLSNVFAKFDFAQKKYCYQSTMKSVAFLEVSALVMPRAFI